VKVVDPSTFLKKLWNLEPLVVQARLREQATAIGVTNEDLLTRLAKLAPDFVKACRRGLI
jgi:hypothetical protein